MTCFNDDIQGTASVVLAGLYSSLLITEMHSLAEHRFLFFGAGEAGVGIGELISSAIAKDTGISLDNARKHCYFVDSKGLVSNQRIANGKQIESHKLPFAHDLTTILAENSLTDIPTNLLDCIKLIKPTVLIGVSAQGSTFTEDVVKEMVKLNKHPVIFALSNPTSKAECTATNAYTWSDGKCIFASGSPFDPVTLPDGRHFVPGQGNNAYIFPGVGLGALLANALTLNDDDFLIAAKALSECVPLSRLQVGCCYPELNHIRQVSAHIAIAVAEHIHQSGRSSGIFGNDVDWPQFCQDVMYTPSYETIEPSLPSAFGGTSEHPHTARRNSFGSRRNSKTGTSVGQAAEHVAAAHGH